MRKRLDFGSVNGRIGTTFMVGAACFAVASIPAIADLISAAAVGAIYFVGSIFFTTAGAMQFFSSTRARDRLASLIQLVGTVFFNVNTFLALLDAIEPTDRDLLIWAPDALGSIAFLVSSGIAQLVALDDVRAGIGRAAQSRRRRGGWPSPLQRLRFALRREWRRARADLRSDEVWIAAINLAGSIAFGISAVAAYVVPDTGEVVNAAAVSTWTLAGALCFFVAAYMLVEERQDADVPDVS
jgi:hypothetical protein